MAWHMWIKYVSNLRKSKVSSIYTEHRCVCIWHMLIVGHKAQGNMFFIKHYQPPCSFAVD